MSNALQVSFPSLHRVQASGSPRKNVSKVLGVRVRTEMASAKLNSFEVVMSNLDAHLPLWTQVTRNEALIVAWTIAAVALPLPQ